MIKLARTKELFDNFVSKNFTSYKKEFEFNKCLNIWSQIKSRISNEEIKNIRKDKTFIIYPYCELDTKTSNDKDKWFIKIFGDFL